MSRNLLIFAVAGLLAACGGGSDGPSTTATAASTTPSPVSTTTQPPAQTTTPTNPPVSTSAELASMPAVTAGAVKMGASSLTLGVNAQVYDMAFSGAVKGDISGQLNKLWVDAKAGGGTMTVSGTQNTIVFRPGVDATVNVTGAANTFIMATGSTIKITGSGAAASTIQYYKP